MRASFLFQLFNGLALAGWVVLALSVAFRRPWLRDTLAGTYVPVLLSAAYAILAVLFLFNAEGGFDTLDNVQTLFTAPFVALAGWVHYLAFDLFMGARVARGFDEQGLPRWPLIVLLPLTFMLGPVGYLVFEIVTAVRVRQSAAAI